MPPSLKTTNQTHQGFLSPCGENFLGSWAPHLEDTFPLLLWTSGCICCIVHSWGGNVCHLPGREEVEDVQSTGHCPQPVFWTWGFKGKRGRGGRKNDRSIDQTSYTNGPRSWSRRHWNWEGFGDQILVLVMMGPPCLLGFLASSSLLAWARLDDGQLHTTCPSWGHPISPKHPPQKP